MKQKKFGKKLNLNKKTIAVLNNAQINAARGGGTVLFQTLPGRNTCCTCGVECPNCDTGGDNSCSDYTNFCPTGLYVC